MTNADFMPIDQPNQCPDKSHFFETVQMCLDFNAFMDVYRQAQAAGNTALVQALWDESHPNGIDIFGVLGSVGNTPQDLAESFFEGLGIDLVKLAVIVVGLILVLIAVTSWLNVGEINVAGYGVNLPKVRE